MAITSTITKTLKHPDEADVTITIRKLSHHQLMMAADARQDAVIEKFKRMGESVKFLPDRDEAGVIAEQPDNKYDRLTVLRCGITAWSYAPEVAAGVEELDEETAAWLFGEIIMFSIRSAEEGKASASASPHSSAPDEDAGPQS